MASIVVYKIVPGGEDRILGMKEAGDRIASATHDPDATPDVILLKTLDDLIAEKDASGGPRYKVKYTHADYKEYVLEIDTNSGNPPSNGKYKYNMSTAGTDYKKLKIVAKKDKTEGSGNENMHLTAPRDPVNLVDGSYLDYVISDIGGTPSDEARKYLFGTIILRRCR